MRSRAESRRVISVWESCTVHGPDWNLPPLPKAVKPQKHKLKVPRLRPGSAMRIKK